MPSQTQQPTRTPSLSQEPDAHVAWRHLQTTLWVSMIVFSVISLVLLFVAPAYVYLAVIPIPLLMVGRAVAGAMMSTTDATELRAGDTKQIGDSEVTADVTAVKLMTILKVFGALALATFVIAVFYFQVETVAIAAVALLLFTLLIELPFVLAGIDDAAEDEVNKLRHTPRP
ncbi:putative membrane protein [Rhodopirellula sallentina SM41]|uniref:Putative membrane protein n=1 Tax=Rhodopirellula sallentina SM41 TaxID=1263870 RepID=M5UA94_9BACT|nr:putative membrane protein [Rhodopirellula sallentina SM41]